MSEFLVSPEILTALQSIDSATVSNAIEAFKVRDRTGGYASMDLRCLTPDLKPMVGYAVTCVMDSTTPGARRPNRLPVLLDAVAAAPKPAVIVVQSAGPDRSRSCFAGDMISAVYWKLGAAGVVTDGGIRDLTGIRGRAPEFHLFAAGTVVSHGNGAILDIGVPVSVCALPIRPGDLLHGDENGLVQIPIDLAGSVLEQARLVQKDEQEFFEFLKSPDYSLQGLKRRIGIH